MYRFALQSEVTELHEWCMDILHQVQDDVREFFTFDIRLIGSGEKRLVTQNSNQAFDLDYNIILQKDKKNLINSPQQIKKLFMDSFKRMLSQKVSGYNYVSDSTSVITAKLIQGKNTSFSFDVAIIVEGNDGFYYRLINDKISGRYIWNQVENSKNYFEKFQVVKRRGLWLKFKKRYLELKNLYLRRNQSKKSFSIFLETLNEVLGQDER